MKLSLLSPLWALAILSTAACPALFAQEWTRFRGPNGSGVSDTALPTSFTEKDFLWKVTLPGEGHGSPVLWGEKLFLLSADAASAERLVMRLDAKTGKMLWVQKFASEPHKLHRYNSFASSTPAVDADRLYVAWTTPRKYTLMALTHEGKKIWEQDLGAFDSQHGGAPSPVLFEDLVIVTNDQQGKSFIASFDAKTGKPRWTLDRGAGEKGSTTYGPPSIYQPDPAQKPQLVVTGKTHGITGIDPTTGKKLWEVADVYDKRSASCPLVAGDLIIGSCGSGGGGNYLVAVRPGGKNPAQLVYKMTQSAPYVPTSIYLNGKLYLVSDGGIATCLDAATGQEVWRERLEGNYFSSPVCANGVIYAIDWEGKVTTFRASDKFEKIGKGELGDTTYATPAIANGRIYMRSMKQLVCIGKP